MPKKLPYAIGERAEYISRLTASRFRTIPVTGRIDELPEIDDVFMSLVLGTHCIVNGRLYQKDGRVISEIDNIYVKESLRSRGIGERLMRAYVAESIAQGAVELRSESVSNMALGVRRKMFGVAALNFYDSDNEKLGILPLSFEQAILSNARIDDLDIDDPERSRRESHLGVTVDLTHLDVSGWERPRHLDSSGSKGTGVIAQRPAHLIGMMFASGE